MLIIDSAIAMSHALDHPLDQHLKQLLELRRNQLLHGTNLELGELAKFIVASPGDTFAAIEVAAGYPVVTELACEWVQQHGRWFEAVAILTDDGFATVLFVPDDEGVDPTLLAYLRSEAVTALPSAIVGNSDGRSITP